MSPSRFRPCRESTLLSGSPSATGVGYGYFYIVLFHNLTIVSDLHRRGCTRTSFEFAKLLYSLDPWTDPHGSLLHLDGLALKAGMHEWILDVWEYFETDKDGFEGRLTPAVLPGWWYARALAMKIREDLTMSQASSITCLCPAHCHLLDFQEHALSTQAFMAAVLRFPSLLPLLADRVDVSLPAEIRSRPAFKLHVDSS